MKGIGPKGAETLLNQFGTLEGIYQNLEQIPDKLRSKLVSDRQNAWLSRELATVMTNVPFPLPDPEDFRYHKKNLGAALGLLQEYEIKTLIREIMAMKEYEPAAEEQAAPLFQDDIFGIAESGDAMDTSPEGKTGYQAFEPRLVNAANLDECNWAEDKRKPSAWIPRQIH